MLGWVTDDRLATARCPPPPVWPVAAYNGVRPWLSASVGEALRLSAVTRHATACVQRGPPVAIPGIDVGVARSSSRSTASPAASILSVIPL